MIAGQLEIQLTADVARISRDMAQVKGVVGSAMQGIQAAAATAVRALGAIGVGLSIAGIIALAKSSIDAMARMKDLGQEAGTTAAAISRFDAPARMAGSSLESVAGAMFRMSKAALEARDPSSKAAQALHAIGISSAQLKGLKPDEMFELVARSVAKYSDGLEKNAVMQELFNRSGKEMNKVVAEIASNGKLVATVTDEQAEAADRLQDQMVTLKMQSEEFWRSLIAKGVPSLNAIMQAFNDARREGNLFEGMVAGLSAAFDKLFAKTVQLQILETSRAIDEQIKLMENLANNAKVFGMTPSFKAVQEQTRVLNELLQKRLGLQEQLRREAEKTNVEASKPTLGFDPAAIAKAAKDALDAQRALEKVQREDWDQRLSDLKDQLEASEKAYDAMKKLEVKMGSQLERDLGQMMENIAEDTGDLITAGLVVYKETIGDLWDEISNRGSQFFTDLVMGGERAFDTLKRYVKGFLAELLALFAKRWILQLGAAATGSSSLAAAAGQAGQGTLTGSALSAAGGYIGGAGTAIGGIYGAAEGFAMGWGSGMAGAGAGLAEMGGAWMSTLGSTGWGLIIVAAIAVVAALADKFRDKENPRVQFAFGAGTADVMGRGPFGTEGFARNEAGGWEHLTAFFDSFKDFDVKVAALLSSSQMAAAQASLASSPQREFSFAPGDQNIGQQLTLEYLQSKYGTIFATIDSTFSDFIRNFKGTSEDLAKEIAAYVAVLETAGASGIKGLDIAALQGWQREGENLAQTLMRVMGTFTAFDEAFMSDAQKLERSQAAVIAVFAELGRAVPESSAEFYDLVHSIDVSTEAGRTLVERLMQIGPAFQTVEQAGREMIASFDAIMGQLRAGYTPALLQMLIDSALQQFQAGNPWSSGLSLQALLEQILTIQRPDFLSYSAANQALITQILSLYQQLRGSGSPLTAFTGGISDLGDTAAAAARQLEQARASIRDYLAGLMRDPDLSVLSPADQMTRGVLDWWTMFQQAQGGDLSALNSLPGFTDEILGIVRNFHGSSSAYVEFFDWITSNLGSLTGEMKDIPTLSLQESQKQTGELHEIRALLLEIRDRDERQAEYVADAVTESGAKIVNAIAGQPESLR